MQLGDADHADVNSFANVSLPHVADHLDSSTSSSGSEADTTDRDSLDESSPYFSVDNDASVVIACFERLSDTDAPDEEDFPSSCNRNRGLDSNNYVPSVSSKRGRVECNDSAAEAVANLEPPPEDVNAVVSPSAESS